MPCTVHVVLCVSRHWTSGFLFFFFSKFFLFIRWFCFLFRFFFHRSRLTLVARYSRSNICFFSETLFGGRSRFAATSTYAFQTPPCPDARRLPTLPHSATARSIAHSNVLRDFHGPVTSSVPVLLAHHAGHSNQRLDLWTCWRREVQQQLWWSNRKIVAQQMRSRWMTPLNYNPQAPQTTQVIMTELVARFSRLLRLHGASHKKVNHQDDPVCTPLRSK